jgi:hypothetical protein
MDRQRSNRILWHRAAKADQLIPIELIHTAEIMNDLGNLFTSIRMAFIMGQLVSV